MVRLVRLVIILAGITASGVSAQSPAAAAAPDSTIPDPNSVKAFAIRSGKLTLSSASSPRPVNVPDGAYANQAEVTLVFVGGRITSLQESTGGITEISSIRLQRQRGITLMPSTNALMAVGEFQLPSGTFKSEDGVRWFTIVMGRPTAFSFASRPPTP